MMRTVEEVKMELAAITWLIAGYQRDKSEWLALMIEIDAMNFRCEKLGIAPVDNTNIAKYILDAEKTIESGEALRNHLLMEFQKVERQLRLFQ